MINCKVELKLRWVKNSVLSILGNENDNTNADSSNIIFTIKDTKLYVPLVTSLTKDNQKLSKFLSKVFKRYVMNIKQKVRFEAQQMNIDILLNQILWELIDCMFWFIQTKMKGLKNFMIKSVIYEKVLSKIKALLSMKITFITKQLKE